jgi:hypothetical protein
VNPQPGTPGPLVPALQEFFAQLRKSLKKIGLYRHQADQYAQFLSPAFGVLQEILDRQGTVGLKVEQNTFKYRGAAVFDEPPSEQNPAFRLYREGVRLLIYRTGLTVQELLDFVLICLGPRRERGRIQEDIVSRLWEKGFAHIEYVVVESYVLGEGDESEDEVEIELDQIIQHIYRSLTGKSSDRVQAARVSLDDLEIELNQVQQARGLVVKNPDVPPPYRYKIQQELEAEEQTYLLPKLLGIILEATADSLDPVTELAVGDVLIQLLDTFLLKEDFNNISRMMASLEKRQEVLEGWRRVFERVREKMSDSERISLVGEAIDTMPNKQEIHRSLDYLQYLDERSFMPLLQTLENLNHPQARRVFCNVLAVVGAARLDKLIAKLSSPKANLVRDLVYVIDKINPADKIQMFARLLAHPNRSIRLEALGAIGASESESGAAYVRKALGDPDAQVRIKAIQLLPGVDPKAAKGLLLRAVGHQDFEKKPTEEQVATFTALAMTDDPEALKFFAEQLQASSLLGRKKLAEHKKNLINGLAYSASINAYKLLKAELERGFKDPEVAATAQRACARLKERLLGG